MKVIINQPFGIGDILFISPLVKELDIEQAIWPVTDHYYWVKDYLDIPNVTFVKESNFVLNDFRSNFTEIPFRIAEHIVPGSQDCMEAKYRLLGADLELWRTLTFERNLKRELSLKEHLSIGFEEEFIFINNNFASPEHNYTTDIQVQAGRRVITQQYIEGFTLLDWCGVLEQAAEIHTVSTALFFVLEALNLKGKELHLYPRKPLDRDLSPIKTLLHPKWICHE
jgi:hypothetical protein